MPPQLRRMSIFWPEEVILGTSEATASWDERSAVWIVALRPSFSIACLVSWLDSSRW